MTKQQQNQKASENLKRLKRLGDVAREYRRRAIARDGGVEMGKSLQIAKRWMRIYGG